MRFEFATAGRVIFGEGVLSETNSIAPQFGKRALIITGSSIERAGDLLESLDRVHVKTGTFSVEHEPTVDMIRTGVRYARDFGCDMVIGIGGGSVIDVGKAVSALVTNPGDIGDYLEVIGKGKPITKPPTPFVAIPTTAGTGAEVTRNAVVLSPEHRVKVSLRSPLMLPKVAIVDPELTYTLPPSITASTGLDALSQLIEPYVSNYANPLSDSFCLRGIELAASSLQIAFTDGKDRKARRYMALASLFGGLALANSKLGAVHGIAGPLGGMYEHAPHGAICGCLLPETIRVNLAALRSRSPESSAIGRFTTVARILTGNQDASAEDSVAWLHNLIHDLGIPSLSTYGISENEFPHLIEKSMKSSSMGGNPISLNPEELSEILINSL